MFLKHILQIISEQCSSDMEKKRYKVDDWKLKLVKNHFDKNTSSNNNSMIEKNVETVSTLADNTEVKDVSLESRASTEDDRSSVISGLGDSNSSSSSKASLEAESGVRLVKPRLVTNMKQFPLKKMVHSADDKGSNCVILIIKSKSSDLKPARLRTILTKKKEVVKQLDKYKETIFKTVSYFTDTRLVYNIIFYHSSNARKFFASINDIFLKEVPKLCSVSVCQQEMLGKDHFQLDICLLDIHVFFPRLST